MARNRSSGADIKFGDGSIRIRDRKDGGKSYQARWFDGVRWRAKTFHGSIEQAEDFLRQRSRDMRTGRYVADDDVTLIQAIDDYLRRGENRWRSSTRASYSDIRDLVHDAKIGSVRLSDLTPRQCQAWIDDLASEYSTNRLNVIRAVVNGALREAMRLGVIHANPMQGIRMPAKQKREYAVWTVEQGQQAIDRSAKHDLLHTYYVVALNTAMRPGEIRALLWRDVDLEAGVISVSATMTRNEDNVTIRGTTTKGGTIRRIAVSSFVVDTLRRYRAKQAERRLKSETWYDQGYVFDRGDGQYLPQSNIARLHKSFAEFAGLPICRLHDLRHSSASMLLEAGVDMTVVAEMLGHTSTRTTQDVYAHVSERQLRQVADVMEQILSHKKAN